METAAGSSSKPAPVFAPEPERSGPLLLEDETWGWDARTYSLRLTRLDDTGRQEFIRRETGINTDPFAARPDRPATFVTFLLELKNSGGGSLSLNPQNCWLFVGAIPEYPLDIPTLESYYRLMEQELPPAYRNAGRALLDRELVLAPGEAASGLLVYRAEIQRAKRFRVEVQLTLASGDVERYTASYRRVKKKNTRK